MSSRRIADLEYQMAILTTRDPHKEEATLEPVISNGEPSQRQSRTRQDKDELESLVQERTRQLQDEIEQTKRAERNLRDLTGHLLAAHDEERRHLARELHDGVGQALAGLAYILAGLKIARSQDHALIETISEGKAMIDRLLADIRTLSYIMHPPLLDELGLDLALRSYADGFSERSKIELDLEIDANIGRLSNDLEIVIFRVVQEGLTVIHQHSGSASAAVRVARREKQVEVEVSDQACGISPQRQHKLAVGKIGVGLRGMQERVRQLGGKLELNSNGKGTHVTAVLPLKRRAAGGSEARYYSTIKQVRLGTT